MKNSNKLKNVAITQKRVTYLKCNSPLPTSERIAHRTTSPPMQRLQNFYGASHNFTIQTLNCTEETTPDEEGNMVNLDEGEISIITTQTDEPTAENANDAKDFYPNAVHCLLALYRQEYENSKSKKQLLVGSETWPRIAQEMNESFFEFTEEQIRKKFTELRTQYMNLNCLEDVGAYFEQMHEIYEDEYIDAIVNERVIAKESRQRAKYLDDDLFRPEVAEAPELIIKTVYDSFEQFEDEESAGFEEKETIIEIKTEKEEYVEEEAQQEPAVVAELPDVPPTKRARLEITQEVPLAKNKTNDNDRITEEVQVEGIKADMTLHEFNEQQERRHQQLRQDIQCLIRLQKQSIELHMQAIQEHRRKT